VGSTILGTIHCMCNWSKYMYSIMQTGPSNMVAGASVMSLLAQLQHVLQVLGNWLQYSCSMCRGIHSIIL